MSLHPFIEQSVNQLRSESFGSDKLKSLLLWFTSGVNSIDTESKRLQSLVEETTQTDPQTCYNMLNSLELNEMVHFTLMNEFGPKFAQRSCYSTLVDSITHRLTHHPRKK